MKAIKPYILFSVSLIMILFSCKGKKAGQPTAHTESYTCPMHPQIIRNQPGNCPICGMSLVKREEKAERIKDVSLESLLKPTNEFVISSIAVTTLAQRTEQPQITAFGKVQYDDRQTGTVSSRFEGRIERMYVKYRYQYIRKGDRLLDIYSPELLTSQQNLLFLLKNDSDNHLLISAARERLLLLGMSAQQIAQAISTGKPLYNVSVYSNYSGYATDAGINKLTENSANMSGNINNTSYNVTTQELTLKEGMYLQKGQPIFTIMNAGRALILLNIFAADQNIIKQGDAVKITPEASSQSFKAIINYIEPFFRGQNKTLTARVYFNNAALKVPVGSNVQAVIFARGQNGSWLPSSAVYTLGLNTVVFKKEGETFRANQVTTGRKEDGNIQVLSGLTQKDSVAVQAQFLIDNESFINVK